MKKYIAQNHQKNTTSVNKICDQIVFITIVERINVKAKIQMKGNRVSVKSFKNIQNFLSSLTKSLAKTQIPTSVKSPKNHIYFSEK